MLRLLLWTWTQGPAVQVAYLVVGQAEDATPAVVIQDVTPSVALTDVTTDVVISEVS